MGAIEVTRYILIVQKVEKTAVTISDVVSQGTTISTSDLNNILTAAGQVMQPYTFGPNGYVIISSVTQTGAYTINNPPLVNWQYTSSGGTWTQNSQVGTTGGSAANLPPAARRCSTRITSSSPKYFINTSQSLPPTASSPAAPFTKPACSSRAWAIDSTLSWLPSLQPVREHHYSWSSFARLQGVS